MNLAQKLDLAIKLKEKGTRDGAYVVETGTSRIIKPTYMENGDWKEFLDGMTEGAKEEYGEGSGGELNEREVAPPKMASYGSSSRMIYKLSHQTPGFHFEKKLATTVGGKANLDGFMEQKNRYVFVEAKCREPYCSKSNLVSVSYAELYSYINERMAGNVEIKTTPCQKERYVEVEYLSGGEQLEHFDLKQMICHLLGIATGMLKGTLKRKQTDFIYLLFDPSELSFDAKTKAEIDSIYDRTVYECNLIDFAELFRTVLEFLNKHKKYSGVMTDEEIDKLVGKFTFTLANQDFYSVLVNNYDR